MAPCVKCGFGGDLRGGYCWYCAHEGERVAANRTVVQHLGKAVSNIVRRRFQNARYDLTWAMERLTHTGDYKPGGYFEKQGHI